MQSQEKKDQSWEDTTSERGHALHSDSPTPSQEQASARSASDEAERQVSDGSGCGEKGKHNARSNSPRRADQPCFIGLSISWVCKWHPIENLSYSPNAKLCIISSTAVRFKISSVNKVLLEHILDMPVAKYICFSCPSFLNCT